MRLSVLAFVIWPYVALAIFVVGHIWRWRQDQFGWTTRTSQILERRWLAWASPIFHIGALLAILGHAAGLLIPMSWTAAIGINEHMYHAIAVTGGVIAGVLVTAGLILLLLRRFLSSARIRLITTGWDRVMYVIVAGTVLFGMWPTFALNVFGSGYDYRATVSIWFRGIFLANPDPILMSAAPWTYQVHVILAFALIAIWPFTRLVHVWSIPVGYLTRPYVVYRRKNAITSENELVAR